MVLTRDQTKEIVEKEVQELFIRAEKTAFPEVDVLRPSILRVAMHQGVEAVAQAENTLPVFDDPTPTLKNSRRETVRIINAVNLHDEDRRNHLLRCLLGADR